MSESSVLTKEQVEKAIKEYIGDAPVVLEKFVDKEERLKDILEGKLYLNTMGFYRKLEAEMGKKGQGDANEGVYVAVPYDVSMCDSKTKEPVYHLGNACKYMKFSYKEDESILLYCMSGIKLNDLEVISFEDNGKHVYVHFKLNYTDKELKRMEEEFGKYVLIANYQDFIERVYEVATEQKMPLIYGDVRYAEENCNEWAKAFAEQSSDRFLFKDKTFSYQNEFRIATYRKNTGDHFLNIGSLKDCTACVKTKKLSQFELTIGFLKKEHLKL